MNIQKLKSKWQKYYPNTVAKTYTDHDIKRFEDRLGEKMPTDLAIYLTCVSKNIFFPIYEYMSTFGLYDTIPIAFDTKRIPPGQTLEEFYSEYNIQCCIHKNFHKNCTSWQRCCNKKCNVIHNPDECLYELGEMDRYGTTCRMYIAMNGSEKGSIWCDDEGYKKMYNTFADFIN